MYHLTAGSIPILQEAQPEIFRTIQALNLLALLSVITAMALRSAGEKDNALRQMEAGKRFTNNGNTCYVRPVARIKQPPCNKGNPECWEKLGCRRNVSSAGETRSRTQVRTLDRDGSLGAANARQGSRDHGR